MPAAALAEFAAAVDAPTADRIRETLEWIAPHCDLEERLPRIPPSAQVRGIWAKILVRQLQERGLWEKYQEMLPMPTPGALGFHPARDLCVQSAVAGALVAGPEQLHQGMFEITRDNSRRFAASLLGRTLVRLLAKDPKRLAQQAIASRRQTCNYGGWELVSASEREVRIYLREEYVWIESYLLGAAVGTFEALADDPADLRADAELEDRFHGTHVICW
ncbi:MAG: TIGR02265 family protein [Deltaproteobacteria bacterium]|nr:TIGR02265 family protein [Deltaproteobacteria bacterium]